MLRHRIMPMATPGMATQDPLSSQPTSFQRTVLLQSLNSIGRAGGGISTGLGQVRRDCLLIELHQQYQQAGEQATHCPKI